MQNGAIRRKNMMTGESKSIKPKLPSDIKNELKYNFITPYLISYHNSNILYHAGNYVVNSYDRGDSWNVISGDLTNSSSPNKLSFSVRVFLKLYNLSKISPLDCFPSSIVNVSNLYLFFNIPSKVLTSLTGVSRF